MSIFILLSFPFAKKKITIVLYSSNATVQFSKSQMMIYHAEYSQLRCNLCTHTHTYVLQSADVFNGCEVKRAITTVSII